MSKKRVLFISAGLFPIPANKGGAVEELIDSFTEHNALENRYDAEVTSCSFQGVEIKTRTAGVKYHYIKTPFYIRIADKLYYLYVDKILKDWRSMFRQHHYQNTYYIKKITKKLDLKAFDAVIVENNMSLLKEIAADMGEEFDAKCMYHMHSDLVDNEEMIPYLARCRKILAVSDFVRTHLYETVPELKDTEIVKVTNGIKSCACSEEERLLLRKNMREQYGIGDSETVYLFSGRVSPEKGVIEMTRAFLRALPLLEHRSRLFIVGSAYSGSDKKNYYYEEIRKAAGRDPEHIILTGYINHDRITDYHIMSDVQIVPSIMDDPAPLTVLEGMSMGLYLLLSRVGGIPEYTREYGNKLFIERDDRFEDHILDAILQYDRETAPHKYVRSIVLYPEKQYFHELAEAIDV